LFEIDFKDSANWEKNKTSVFVFLFRSAAYLRICFKDSANWEKNKTSVFVFSSEVQPIFILWVKLTVKSIFSKSIQKIVFHFSL